MLVARCILIPSKATDNPLVTFVGFSYNAKDLNFNLEFKSMINCSALAREVVFPYKF